MTDRQQTLVSVSWKIFKAQNISWAGLKFVTDASTVNRNYSK